MKTTVEWFVGVDWGADTHQVCVMDADGCCRWERHVRHAAPEIAAFIAWLKRETHAASDCVAVALETPRGTLVDTLLEHGFVVYAINPKQVDRFRDRYTVAGAKDDRRDALTLATALRTDPGAFQRVAVEDARIVQLRELSRMDEDLQRDLNGLSNRLRQQIYRIQPAWLELCPAADEPWFWRLLEEAIVPARQRRLRQSRIQTILQTHRIRRITVARVVEILRADTVHSAPGVRLAARRHIASLLLRLRVVHQERRRCEAAVEALLDALREADKATAGCADLEILESLPGVGARVAAIVLVEAGRPLTERNYPRLRASMGLAPVTQRSGKRTPLVQL